MGRARNLRLHVGLPKQFWAESINTMVYLINRSQSVLLNEGLLEKTWSEKMVSLSHLKMFSYSSYLHINIGLRSKLDLKSVKYTFIRYNSNEFEYKFWDYQNQKFIESRNITFNEREMYKDKNEPQGDSSITSKELSKYLEIEDEDDI